MLGTWYFKSLPIGLAGYLVLSWLLRKLSSLLMGTLALDTLRACWPVRRLRLEPSPPSRTLKRKMAPLLRAGFRDLGGWLSEGRRLQAAQDEHRGLLVVLSDSSAEILCQLRDGSVRTWSNAAMPCRVGQTIVACSLPELLKRALADLGEVEPGHAIGFPHEYQLKYADDLDRLHSLGGPPLDPDSNQNKNWSARQLACDDLQVSLRERWQDVDPKYSPQQHMIVFVWDGQPCRPHLECLLSNYLPELNLDDFPEGLTERQALAQLLQDTAWEKSGELSHPVAADCYRLRDYDPSLVLTGRLNGTENGRAYQRATLSLAEIDRLEIPAGTRVQTDDDSSDLRLFLEILVGFAGHRSGFTIRRERKSVGCIMKIHDRTLRLCRHGDWDSQIEGGVSVEMLVKVPSRLRVVKSRPLPTPQNPIEVRPGWQIVANQPDPERTAERRPP
ncbi:hypothetical protein IV102_10435 [bacterium]|nr:hypothetical protein [bacterium]